MSFFNAIQQQIQTTIFLKHGHREWQIQLQGRDLTAGWNAYIMDNNIQNYYLILFLFDRQNIFDTIIFNEHQFQDYLPWTTPFSTTNTNPSPVNGGKTIFVYKTMNCFHN